MGRPTVSGVMHVPVKSHLAYGGGKDGEVWAQGKGQGADGVQGVSAKRILAAIQDTQEGM